jgi:hypothetical protein
MSSRHSNGFKWAKVSLMPICASAVAAQNSVYRRIYLESAISLSIALLVSAWDQLAGAITFIPGAFLLAATLGANPVAA